MPTTIFDSSLITQRNKNKAIANSFISRIQNPSPVNGSAPLLGITEQSLINSVVNGQITYYRKNNSGYTTINLGCPCTIQSNTIVNSGGGGVVPGPVTNITYEYGSLIISWNAPLTGDIPFTYLVELQATNPIYNVSATTSNTSYTFINNQLVPGIGYLIAVTPTNTAGTGRTSYYKEGEIHTEVIGLYQAPNITVPSFSVNTCTLGFSFPISGQGFTITSITTDPVLPLGWSIQSFSNSQIVLLNSGSNPASIPDTRFTFGGALGQTTNSSNLVAGIQTAGLNPNYWATNMGANSSNTISGISTDSSGNFYLIGTFSDSTFLINDYTTISTGNVVTSTFGTLVNSTGTDKDIFLVKYNSLGQVVWATTITGPYIEVSSAIITDSSGNIFITGYTNSNITINDWDSVISGVVNVTLFGILNISSTPTTNYDMFVIKYNPSGKAQWGTRIGSTLSNRDERAVAICTDSSGNIYVTGSSNATNSINITSYNGKDIFNVIQLVAWGALAKSSFGFDTFIVKYDNSGQAKWATINRRSAGNNFAYDIIYNPNNDSIYFMGTSSNSTTINSYVTVTGGNVVLTQFGTIPITSSTVYIVQYNLLGQAQLITTIRSGLNSKCIRDNLGNIYVSGYNVITAGLLINNSAGGINVTPYATLPDSASTNTDGYIVKYNSSLEAQWGTTISALDNNGILGITSDGTYIYVIGFFISSSINVNDFSSESSGVITVAPYGSLAKGTANTNYYIAKYDTDGKAQWTTRLDGITSSTVASAKITTDSSGNICVTGFYDINPLAISAFSSESGGTINVLPYGNLATNGTSSNFIIKLNSNGQFT